MTIDAARTQARRYARVSSTQADNTQVNNLMQDALDEFATDVDGFPKEEYLSIEARFDTKTNYAIHIVIVGGSSDATDEDIVITGTARANTTGTIAASDFEATLQTATGNSETITWADFGFTVDTLDATSITYSAPTTVTYVDAQELFGFGGTPTLTDFKHTGNFPQDCTMEATIPSDAFKVERVEWDQNKIYKLPAGYFVSPEASGDPQYYRVRGREIRLLPSPETQELFHIEYKGAPTALVFQGYQDSGLTSKANESATGLATTTQYYYKIAINGAAVTEYDITTASDATFAAVIILLNAENTGATWSLVGGDLRCASNAVVDRSSIAVTAGTTGTDLLTTMSMTMETAVAGDTDLPTEIPGTFQQYVPRLVASKLLDETHEKMANYNYGKYLQGVNKYKSDYHNRDTAVSVDQTVARLPKVTI